MVKKVFSVLIKVPCYIAASYLVINIVLFAVFYFRALGMSYVVMQTVVENNYIPANEAVTIKASLDTFNSVSDGGQSGGVRVPVVHNLAMYVDTTGTLSEQELYGVGMSVGSNGITTPSVNNRKQYGNSITVGIGFEYTAVLPLANGSVLEYISNYVTTPVRITYTVPGLKYYPDLS